MKLILFRHGPAGSHTVDPAQDSERPLTDRGVARTRRAARGLAQIERRVSAIWTSPYARAHQTARLLAEALGTQRVEPVEDLAPGGSQRKLLEGLARFGANDTVVLVGHEPYLGKLTTLLLFGAALSLSLKKAGACSIVIEGAPRPGAGELQWLLAPRILRRVSRVRVRV
jgi:phosphohistidine phosphatase